jgi:hypothetical protein
MNMLVFNPFYWYWVVGGSITQVFSSAANDYVAITDTTYETWLAEGYMPTVVASEDDLAVILAQYGITPTFDAGLILYAHTKQKALATGQVTVNAAPSGGPLLVVVSLDPDSKANLTGAYNLAQLDNTTVTQWVNGTTVTSLDAAHILHMAPLVGNFVNATFTTLATVLAGIAADTITTTAQIDAAAWPATS